MGGGLTSPQKSSKLKIKQINDLDVCSLWTIKVFHLTIDSKGITVMVKYRYKDHENGGHKVKAVTIAVVMWL